MCTYYFVFLCFLFSGVTLLTAFSIKRNWYRLVAETKPDKEIRDMRCLHAIKTLSLFNITSGHIIWYMTATPFINPIFVEKVNVISQWQEQLKSTAIQLLVECAFSALALIATTNFNYLIFFYESGLCVILLNCFDLIYCVVILSLELS